MINCQIPRSRFVLFSCHAIYKLVFLTFSWEGAGRIYTMSKWTLVDFRFNTRLFVLFFSCRNQTRSQMVICSRMYLLAYMYECLHRTALCRKCSHLHPFRSNTPPPAFNPLCVFGRQMRRGNKGRQGWGGRFGGCWWTAVGLCIHWNFKHLV